MSIGSALQAGVSGLRALSTKLATISDNIANSSTVGYKRYDTQFSSLVLNGSSKNTFSAGGTEANVRTEIGKAGTIVGSSTNTDLAISGGGFFAVRDGADAGDFSLTRAGSFRPDPTGALRNTAGAFLQGFPLNPDGTYANGVPNLANFDSLETINLGTINGTGRPTTEMSFKGNLPQGTAAGTTFQTSIQAFDEFGAPQTINLEWTANAGANNWDLEITDQGTGTVLTTLPNIDFNTVSGAPEYLGAPTVGAAMNAATGVLTFDADGAGPGTRTIEIALGAEGTFDGTTQFSGDYLAQTTADGSSLGALQSLEIQQDGTVVALFDNGDQRPIYQIPLADVTNPDGLTARDGNTYELSATSGALSLGTATIGGLGQVRSNALESSNVDLAEELTSLIETQRAYSSNATIVRTADEMLEEVTRLKR